MNYSKITANYVSFSLLISLSFACSSHSQSSADQKSDGKIPSSWINTKSDDKGDASADIVMPDAQTDKVVQSALNANVTALDQAQLPVASSTSTPSSRLSTHPANWAPWHLDGMVGYFAVSQGGILGALLYAGTESIKLTWQKAETVSTAPAAPIPAPLLAMKVTPDMTAQDLPNALEPSIQVALASGAIKDEVTFRRNILLHAEKFFNICQLLNMITRSPGWYVDGYQLNVNFSASGQVTPLIGVGGSVNLYFDWSRTTDPTTQPTTTTYSAQTTNQLNSFVQLMSAAIPEAVQDSADIEKSGFHLDMVQVGLGITAGGDVGVAQATGGDIGRILFKRDLHVNQSPNASVSPAPANDQELNLVSTDVSKGETVVKVNTRKFSNGLKKAIKMATYFADRAHKNSNSKYKLNQIEAEFDTSLSGSLKLATVNGIGQFVLDFDLIQ
jgi:hypothetical protein